MTTSGMDEIAVAITNADGRSRMVLVCEHASPAIPESLGVLGLSEAARYSHIAWDPGADQLAKRMADRLDAVLVSGGMSRLVYDCNRPPEAPDAIPARSEAFEVPGNAHLTDAQRAERVALAYEPFRAAVAGALARRDDPVLVTVHSFTPVYDGKPRQVEVGVLHDSDSRLADALLDRCTDHMTADVRRNAPYGPADGVTHTLREHALPGGHLNVMLEVRNDLLTSEDQVADMAMRLSLWLQSTVTALEPAT